ncbi:MAG: ComEC/Rec2 family competence protein [Alphaproteobacteria bacterium]|nr:ComEC/Rec2 family competence protein [Alphaproteobacteria bacterium]
MRQVIYQRVTAALPGEDGALAAALMMGERGAMPKELITAMRDSGLQHLLSISGLHIGLIVGLVFFALRALLALVPAVALRFPIKKWAAGAATLAGFAYLLLSGSEVPAERAFLMTGIVLFGVFVDRIALSIGLLAWAAIGVLLLEPEALLGASFQLSFAAMLALIAAYEAIGPRLKLWLKTLPGPTKLSLYVASMVVSSLVAGLSTGIIGLFHFNRIAVYGLAANAVAIPATSLWVMPWIIATFLLMPFGLEEYGLLPMSYGLDLINACARAVAAWPGATHLVPALDSWPLPLAALGLVWLCLWKRPWRLLGVPVIAGAVFLGLRAPPPDVLVSDDGGLVAVRAVGGGLLFSTTRSHGFDRLVWLERDGVKSGGGVFPRNGEGTSGALA